MRPWQRVALLTTLGTVAVVGLVFAVTTSAFADGAGATHYSQDYDNVTQTFVPPDPMATNPCSGAPGTLTITYSGFAHVTVNKAGDEWDTGNLHGDFSFVPNDSTLPTYTGHFQQWFGDSFNRNNSVSHFTFNIHGTGSDGSTLDFHQNAHLNINTDGTISLMFDHMTC